MRNYEKIYQVDLDIIKNVIKEYDIKLKQINGMIDKKNKKITDDDKIFLLIFLINLFI